MSTTISLIQNLSVSRYTQTAFTSQLVGELSFVQGTNSSGSVTVTGTNDISGLSQVVVVQDVANAVGATFSLQFDVLGIVITGATTVNYTCPVFNTTALRTAAIAAAVCTADICLRAALPVNVTIPFGNSVLPAKADADLSVGNYQGWVLYAVPTQAQLSADSTSPNNMWQPYYGDWNQVPSLSSTVVASIKTDRASPLTLVDGTTANSFQYTWSAYSQILDSYLSGKYDGTAASVQFTFSSLASVSAADTSVYVNGISTALTNVSVSSNIVDCSQLTLNIGDIVTVKIKAYTPTATDLAFDPDDNPTTDNPLQLTQYKYDYQYTLQDVRDDDGNVTSTLYYFWVNNKDLATFGRSMSIASAAELLTANTDPYLIFQNITNPTTVGVPSYNQVIGAGLNQYITEDNTYKVRFTRDSVLRNNPRGENLKNVHTEWTLIRENQTTLIPQQLWDLLTDSACGQNAVGDPVPSLANVAYDERNGTSIRYGFGTGQTFVDQDLALASIKYAILNTSLTVISQANGGQEVPNPISFINASNIESLFSTPVTIRQTMSNIWTQAQPQQVNEIFFTVLYDALSENYEFTDIFKTSMIAAHSIRLFNTANTL
jgi:hypothetical protein